MKHEFFNTKPVDGIDRVDGRQKVTGAARYAADYQLPGMSYGVLVASTITRGQISHIDTTTALLQPGVLAILSHVNAPKIPGYARSTNPATPANGSQPLRVFFDGQVYFNGQPIALVIADSLERAKHAAAFVKTTYQELPHQTDLLANASLAALPTGTRFADYIRGTPDAYKSAPVQVEAHYTMPVDVHNPMELHSIIAGWDEAGKVTVYDKTQGIKSDQRTIMEAFALTESQVQVYSEFVGGAFGSALRTWPHVVAAVLGARVVGRPLKLVLDRDQMFTMVGYRPFSLQKIGLGATADGRLTGITHEAIAQTSRYEEFTDRTVGLSKFLYACPNVHTSYKIVPLDVSTPTWMRGPGDATGSFALESAMDELSYALKMDPLVLRLRNYAETNPEQNLPWSSKYLRECYAIGAERIGWYKRNPEPRSMRAGRMMVGYGVSSGTFGAGRGRASAKARLTADGKLVIQSAATDIGPGTGTAMVMIASALMGMNRADVVFELGDSSFPPAPTQGGSTLLSTVGSAVNDVCVALQRKLTEMLRLGGPASFKNASQADFIFRDNGIGLLSKPGLHISYVDVLKNARLPSVELIQESMPGEERQKYAMYAFSVHFVEVHVDPVTGSVKVHRVVSVVDTGKIVSLKTATSQLIGGVVGGIGMALMEAGVMDHRYGKYVNNNLAGYHVPVNADVPLIEALFIDKKDPFTNPMGSKGLGEIAIVGFAAALANAVFHATGRRIRDLPITPDKLLGMGYGV